MLLFIPCEFLVFCRQLPFPPCPIVEDRQFNASSIRYSFLSLYGPILSGFLFSIGLFEKAPMICLIIWFDFYRSDINSHLAIVEQICSLKIGEIAYSKLSTQAFYIHIQNAFKQPTLILEYSNVIIKIFQRYY